MLIYSYITEGDDHKLIELVLAPIAQVVERPLRDREVAGSILGRAIPKA